MRAPAPARSWQQVPGGGQTRASAASWRRWPGHTSRSNMRQAGLPPTARISQPHALAPRPLLPPNRIRFDISVYDFGCQVQDAPGAGAVAGQVLYLTYGMQPGGVNISGAISDALADNNGNVKRDCVFSGPIQQTGSLCS